jgi:hypothetical protein
LKISDEINIPGEGDELIGVRVELASRLRLSVSTLITVVKNREEIERSYVQCGLFSEQWKLLKHWHGRNLNLHLLYGSSKHLRIMLGTHLKEKVLHIAACQGIANFSASSGLISRFERRQH